MSSEARFALSKHEAKALYGLTERDFRLIGPPDLVQGRRPMGVKYLYRIERLERWIAAHQEELAGLAGPRAGRRQAAQAAAQTRRAETLRWAAQVPLEVDSPLPRDLEVQVCDYYGVSRIDTEHLVEFVRWRFSNYPVLLKELAGRTGAREARQTLKARMDEQIRTALATPKV
jgi:hypothetical protein